jgi:putative ABC transport system ATP-binding protein
MSCLMLDVRNLCKSYRRVSGFVRALQDVSLRIEAGEFAAVQGPSGCGKTTLLLAAGGLLTPDRGSVLIDGQDLYALPPEKRAVVRAEAIGFVFQQFHLIPYLTVMEQILAPTIAVSAADGLQRAEELVQHFNLAERRSHFPADLSTGERQRTALARALMNKPRLLLADEPTGNLDERNSENVLNYLAEFARAGGAVLLVTHDARAARFANRCLSMEQGRLVG